jgi:hypothetical protein
MEALILKDLSSLCNLPPICRAHGSLQKENAATLVAALPFRLA